MAFRYLSKFITQLLAQGGIQASKGNLYVSGNSFLFLPIESYVHLYKGIINTFGEKNGKEFIFWLGYIQGYSSIKIFIKRMGYQAKSLITKDDFITFMDGANTVGMGVYEIIEYLPNEKGTIRCNNPLFSTEYIAKYGKSSVAIDDYMRGIIEGGSAALFAGPFPIITETKCYGKGDPYCEYNINFSDKKTNTTLDFLPFETLNLTTQYEDTLVKGKSLVGTIFSKKEVNFVDGAFVYRNIQGIIIPTHLFAIICRALQEKNKPEFEKTLITIAQSYIDLIVKDQLIALKKGLLSPEKITELFFIFGLGEFTIKYLSKTTVSVTNTSNAYAKNYLQLFSKQTSGIDFYAMSLLKAFFSIKHDTHVNIKEVSCMAEQKTSCSFIIEI